MRNFVIFQVFTALFLTVFMPISGHASSLRELGKYIWGPPRSEYVRPYLEEAKLPHNSRWADDEWSPQDWIDSRGGNAVNVVNGFYEAGIISDQYMDDDIPVLEVGQGFLELGAQDKRRVVAFIDEVFGVTKHGNPPVIMIYFHDRKETPVGVFNAQGLQLQ